MKIHPKYKINFSEYSMLLYFLTYEFDKVEIGHIIKIDIANGLCRKGILKKIKIIFI